MSDLDRRQFIAVLGAVTAVRHLPLTGIGTGASSIRVGYAAITWGGKDEQAIDAILAATDPASVGLLFDIAHYQQGGGDPVTAIGRHAKRIKAVHVKDVRPIAAAPGYQWVELGRGRVDVKGCVAALKTAGYEGWAIVELDRVVDPDGTPKASAAANRQYVETQLGLTV